MRTVSLALLTITTYAVGFAQTGVQAERDVQYGEANGQKLLLDVYRSTTEEVRPAIVVIHGGGWSAGNKSQMAPVAERFARSGFVAFSVGYRLVKPDRDKYPAQLDDVQLAVRWIRKNASEYKVDPERIGAIGFSAGGHLAALLGTRDTRDKAIYPEFSSKVQAVVDVFGPADFDPSQKDIVGPVAMAILTNLIGKSPDAAPELYRDASPVHHVSKDSAPFLIFHGIDDNLVPVDQSRRLEKALKAKGVEVTLVEFEGEGHGFRKPETNLRMFDESIKFFQKHLTKGA